MHKAMITHTVAVVANAPSGADAKKLKALLSVGVVCANSIPLTPLDRTEPRFLLQQVLAITLQTCPAETEDWSGPLGGGCIAWGSS